MGKSTQAHACLLVRYPTALNGACFQVSMYVMHWIFLSVVISSLPHEIPYYSSYLDLVFKGLFACTYAQVRYFRVLNESIFKDMQGKKMLDLI